GLAGRSLTGQPLDTSRIVFAQPKGRFHNRLYRQQPYLAGARQAPPRAGQARPDICAHHDGVLRCLLQEHCARAGEWSRGARLFPACIPHLPAERYGLLLPSFPEEDPLQPYTYWHTSKPGDLIWDSGAYSGATTCLLPSMVG